MSYQNAYEIYLKQKYEIIVQIAKLKVLIDELFEDMLSSITHKEWVIISKQISYVKAYIKTL